MDKAMTAKEIRQYVVFKVGNEDYGADIHKVSIIEKAMNIARVPATADCIKGVVNLRGEIIPVMDMRARFGILSKESDDDTRIIIFKLADLSIGIIVDAVNEVVQLTDNDIENVSSITNDRSMDYLNGVGKVNGRLVTLLNIEKLVMDTVVTKI
jgi:purine-binding chemotaxis protein CheW